MIRLRGDFVNPTFRLKKEKKGKSCLSFLLI